jgi:GNAT superfamily N-acetyltransferase
MGMKTLGIGNASERPYARRSIAMISPTDRPSIMPLGPQHEAELARLLLSLDKASRVSRFACAASDAALIAHSQRALTTSTWIAGLFADHRLRGVVEVYDLGPPGLVEAAFLVEPDWRRRGFGTALLQAALQWASEAERIVLRMVFSRCNWPMRKLAGKADARLDLAFDEIAADVAIAAPGVRAPARCEVYG